MARVRNLKCVGSKYTQVFSTGRKGPGGAYHHYEGHVIGSTDFPCIEVNFQKGPVQESGANGCFMEDLLAIVIDRLECFQAGPFPSKHNAKALEYVQKAMDQLNARTKDRTKRGVQGKSMA
jgi:hypothetical protein